MNTKVSSITPKIFCASLATLLLWACVPEKKPQPKKQTRAQALKSRAPVVVVKPRFTLELPRLLKPVPRPAARVVHLLYTSSVDGELEPCG